LHAKAVQTQKAGGVPGEEIKEAAVGHVAAKSPAGQGAVMVNLAVIQSVPTLKKDAALVIGMNHVHLALLLVFFNKLLQRFFPELFQGGINADMAAHLFDKLDLIAFEQDFLIFFTAGAALTAILEDGFEGSIVGGGDSHDCSRSVRVKRSADIKRM
jgi:hypothetical protein